MPPGEIRLNERRFYQKITCYQCRLQQGYSDSQSVLCQGAKQTAVHDNAAAELIVQRANSTKTKYGADYMDPPGFSIHRAHSNRLSIFDDVLHLIWPLLTPASSHPMLPSVAPLLDERPRHLLYLPIQGPRHVVLPYPETMPYMTFLFPRNCRG